jgi:RNA polymerase sigma factor (sigma-70 family)
MNSLAEIIDGCSRQERRSQQLFYEQYHRLCMAIAFRYVESFEKAKDVSQNAFLKMFRCLGRFEVKDAINLEHLVHSWIATIVKNASIDYLRRENARGRGLATFELTEDYADADRSPDQKLLQKDLVALITRLPPAYRTAFSLYVIEGYSHPDIAKILKIKCGTSKSNLSKARAHLQKILGKI